MSDAGTFDAARFESRREELGLRLGTPLTAMAETGSTNDDAFTAARSGAPHGAVFVADAQRSGRGRRGSAWTSPSGENLTFSILLRPSLPAERIAAIALVAGLAVRAAAATRIREPVVIKWPNDVLSTGRKLAGILVESRLSGAEVEAVVVGVGVNVSMRELPPDIASIATSLALLGDPAPNRETLLAEILCGFEERLARFEYAGLSALLPELNEHDALRDESLKVGEVRGTGAGIGAEGALLLRDATGRIHRITSGTVERS
ncbi:MAG TPA: biotin--[acetyl-CoA-carboxylase] ligase [Polyangiaceae bacterium]|jgi:BirA family biotin operon repressor/biotin-[acetyl-CoA-carboxylase] ligase|nr:biotin--[acetyl-CoA-carboxylase] ligase [Polyangiaceae bacterium]